MAAEASYKPQFYVVGLGIEESDDAYRDPSNTYDPGGRIGQLMFRINW